MKRSERPQPQQPPREDTTPTTGRSAEFDEFECVYPLFCPQCGCPLPEILHQCPQCRQPICPQCGGG